MNIGRYLRNQRWSKCQNYILSAKGTNCVKEISLAFVIWRESFIMFLAPWINHCSISHDTDIHTTTIRCGLSNHQMKHRKKNAVLNSCII